MANNEKDKIFRSGLVAGMWVGTIVTGLFTGKLLSFDGRTAWSLMMI